MGLISRNAFGEKRKVREDSRRLSDEERRIYKAQDSAVTAMHKAIDELDHFRQVMGDVQSIDDIKKNKAYGEAMSATKTIYTLIDKLSNSRAY